MKHFEETLVQWRHPALGKRLACSSHPRTIHAQAQRQRREEEVHNLTSMATTIKPNSRPAVSPPLSPHFTCTLAALGPSRRAPHAFNVCEHMISRTTLERSRMNITEGLELKRMVQAVNMASSRVAVVGRHLTGKPACDVDPPRKGKGAFGTSLDDTADTPRRWVHGAV